jgi:hypothetical protein
VKNLSYNKRLTYGGAGEGAGRPESLREAGKPGELRGEFFRKNIDNFSMAAYTYKVKIWAVLA